MRAITGYSQPSGIDAAASIRGTASAGRFVMARHFGFRRKRFNG